MKKALRLEKDARSVPFWSGFEISNVQIFIQRQPFASHPPGSTKSNSRQVSAGIFYGSALAIYNHL
jgi:hypothetical protein